MKKSKPIYLLGILLFILACKQDKTIPVTSTKLSDNFTNYTYSRTSKEIASLGRVLFYDKTLSINNSISCGSCHKQALAFTDGQQFSRGFENKLTSRNTPGIQDLGNFFELNSDKTDFFGSASLFWDGRETNLNNMVTRPIINHIEMGLDNFEKIVEKVKSKPYYKDMFIATYGNEEVNMNKIANAISAFIININSEASKFEKNELNAQELRGLNLFTDKYNCNACHRIGDGVYIVLPNAFSDIGLDKTSSDLGRYEVTKNNSDKGKFKIPNLRNVEFTGPYMHDGRFKTLDEVLDHYSIGINNSDNLDFRLKSDNGQGAMKFNINDADKKDIIAFMRTLSDHKLISDPKFSDPFIKQ